MKPVASPIVFHLSRFLGAGDAAAELATALACHATQTGHVCADLDCEAGWGPWAAELDASRRAAFRAQIPELTIVGGADDWTPLVWDDRRLFLRRYWDYEQQVAQDLLARSALENRLTVISGGPGTGKTTTLARIVGLLQEQSGSQPLRIALAAPTGKAAARMADALAAAGVVVNGGAQTLHRLLGMRADGSGFRHDRAHPLAVDVLLVDEASMIDLSLMAHLLAALPADARLFLLGDRDQLSAVEAGAVFADLCASASLTPCVTTLTTNFRFGGDSGIGRLAESLRLGDASGAIEQLRAGGPDLDWQDMSQRGDMRALIVAARDGYRPYRESVAAALPPEALFERFNDFRVLCAHRQDVVAINRALMAGDALRPAPGTPVMVVRNDPLLRLFNGDIGLVLPDPADDSLKACFPGGNDGPRWIPLTRLPAWEPAWAMTVHKSQGSEFENVLLALPSAVSLVTTRELVYTGVTRARRRVVLWASAAVLQAALECRAERMSGLREKLSSAYRSD
ncbi:MAG: exodeoxyribonuclease V subunit alpha [Rhodocyclaceae bacterium]|nr:exodeoxyribonuclease V subunit alpha [Rhodocyclaceae bacterium]